MGIRGELFAPCVRKRASRGLVLVLALIQRCNLWFLTISCILFTKTAQLQVLYEEDHLREAIDFDANTSLAEHCLSVASLCSKCIIMCSIKIRA